ncbi:MAG: DUF6067 family protein [Parabacteroides sp.]|nr:DUF6067 family protein [Parabacteroides sp.]
MKQSILTAGIFISFLLAGCASQETSPDGESQYRNYAPDGIPFVVSATEWQADRQGNHRAVVSVNETPATPAVQVELPWRRPDLRPETKKVVVTDATTGLEIKNVLIRELSAEKGVIVFEPITVPGNYYVYYLPYKFRKGSDDARYGKPWNDYLPPVYEADSAWVASVTSGNNSPAKARVLRFESRSRFDFFTSMGTIATARETDSLKQAHPENPVLFTEDRAYPIRLTNRLPVRWVRENGPSDQFTGHALQNEYYVWQIGVWAARETLKNVKLRFGDFTNGTDTIYRDEVTCFNQEGINWDGNPVTFPINVPEGKIQALWCGIQVPENARKGNYEGTATLTADGIAPRNIQIRINVDKAVLADKGDSDLWRHARLRWLNSRIGEDLLPTTPYRDMVLAGHTVAATDKYVSVGGNGLPDSIRINDRQVLAEPLRFIVHTRRGPVAFDASNVQLSQAAPGLIRWQASSVQGSIRFDCNAYMEYDGYIRYHLRVASERPEVIDDIQLVSRYTPYASEYFMGTGFRGGFRPDAYRWDWKGPWDSYWIGGARAGLHVEFRGGTYHGPLLNDYKPAPPQVWANNGKGSISVTGAKGQSARIIASTGKDTLTAEPKDFEFAVLITPLKPLDPAKHFSERYFHADPSGFDRAAEEGANIANIHHAKPLNPVINYPFLVRDPLIAFIRHEHQCDRKVKLYYTIRELSNSAVEIYALKSLGHEIFVTGAGYGLPWHCEHLIDDYKPAWYAELPGEKSDAALVLNGFSRWINYYLEGARWMFETYDIDGIYMDDVSFDRTVMKRMRKIMNRYHPGALIDLHSNTGYSVGPANQYTDFFPYIDRLWFGESFRYNQMQPDEWFVTFSGIPFGLMSEMLQDGGNRFLGMVYGATGRHSYSQYSPAPIWALWKSFGIEDAQMLGYWDENCPVCTSSPHVKATAYVKPDQVLIALGNFDTNDHTVQLSFDWNALGTNPGSIRLEAPAIQDFQEAQTFTTGESIPVKSKEGRIILLTKTKATR